MWDKQSAEQRESDAKESAHSESAADTHTHTARERAHALA